MELPPDDQLLASAARFLIDGREEDVANLLLSCSLSVWESGDSWFVGDETHYALHVKLTGLHAAYEVLRNDRYPITQSICRAFDAIYPKILTSSISLFT